MVDLPEAQISKLWLAIEYALLIGMTIVSLSLTTNNSQRQAILLLFLLFLLTNAWKDHIAMGQIYICIPFFAMLFYWFLYKNKNIIVRAAAAGVMAACLVLTGRDQQHFLFIPFLFLCPELCTSARMLAYMAPVVLFAAWTLMRAGKNMRYGRNTAGL